MKVLYVHHSPGVGGASNSLYYLLNSLKEKDVEIHIITPKGPIIDKFLSLTPHVYPLQQTEAVAVFFSGAGMDFLIPKLIRGIYNNRASLKEIYDIMKRVKPDIVHFNDSGMIFSARHAKKLGLPVVMHARTAVNNNSWLSNSIVNYFINKYVDKILCISDSVKQGFRGVIPNKLKTIYNPYSEFNSNLQDPRSKNSSFNGLFLGHMLLYKGIYELIDAAVILRNYKDIHFFIAGDNVRENSFFKKFPNNLLDFLNLYPNVGRRVQEKIEKYELSNVHFLGYINNISELMEKMHVNIAPMRLNSPPRSIFETGMYGIPSILSLKDKVEDIVEHGVTGLIIPERKSKDLANAILYLYENEAERIKMGINSKEKYSRLHNSEKSANSVLGVYKDVLSNIQLK